MKKTFSLLALVLWSLGTVAYAANIYVDQNATGAQDGTSQADAFLTIQTAITSATTTDGDTIIVAPGTYSENITLTKSLTLKGANAGVAGNATRGTETIIDAGNTSAAILVSTSTVVIDGFTITNGGGSYSTGIWMGNTDPANVTIKNNIFTSNVSGVWADCSGNCVIENNLFDGNNDDPNAAVSGGISADSTSGLTIRNNEFKNEANGNPILLQAAAAGAHTNIIVSGNNFHDNAYSNVYVIGVTTGSFTDNTVTPASNATGFSFSGANTAITLTGNTITNGQRGIRIEDAGYGLGVNTNFTIRNNAFSGNTEYAIGVVSSGYPSGTIDARLNTYGAASGPTITSNPAGTGDPVVGTEVDFSPWYTTTGKTKLDFLTVDTTSTKTATVPESFTRSGSIATMDLLSGTVLTGTLAWNGEFNFPAATTTYAIVPGSGFSATDVKAIELGQIDALVTSSVPVKVVLTGKSDMAVGLFNETFTDGFKKVTATCDSTTSPTLAAGESCTVASGTDLIVFTKTPTTVVYYKELLAGGSVGNSSSGGGSVGQVLGASTSTAPMTTTSTTTATTSPGLIITVSSVTTGGEVLGVNKFTFTRNLAFGSVGDDVKELQKILIEAGLLKIKAPTGWFGPLTKAALIKWQIAHNIPATGVFGVRSRGFLNQ